MEVLNNKLNENHKMVKDLPDNAKELPKFLSACRSLFNTVNPNGDEELKIIFDFLKQKLNSEIFLTFQDQNFKSLEEFESALKNHYLKKVPSYSFYIDLLSLKQKHNEPVRAFVNRIINKKNECLMQNQPGELNINEIMMQSLKHGLEPRLKIFAQVKGEKSFDKLVQELEELECDISTQSAINEVNVANLLLGASKSDTEETQKTVPKETGLSSAQELNFYRDFYNRNHRKPQYQEKTYYNVTQDRRPSANFGYAQRQNNAQFRPFNNNFNQNRQVSYAYRQNANNFNPNRNHAQNATPNAGINRSQPFTQRNNFQRYNPQSKPAKNQQNGQNIHNNKNDQNKRYSDECRDGRNVI